MTTIPPLGNGDMDRPFESYVEPVETTAYEDAAACGGLSLASATLPVDDVDRAALIFHFQHADGTAHQPVVLVLDDEQMMAVATLIAQAARRAVAGARRQRRGK